LLGRALRRDGAQPEKPAHAGLFSPADAVYLSGASPLPGCGGNQGAVHVNLEQLRINRLHIVRARDEIFVLAATPTTWTG